MSCFLVAPSTGAMVPHIPPWPTAHATLPCGQLMPPRGTQGSLGCRVQPALAPCRRLTRHTLPASCCFAGRWLNEASVDAVSH